MPQSLDAHESRSTTNASLVQAAVVKVVHIELAAETQFYVRPGMLKGLDQDPVDSEIVRALGYDPATDSINSIGQLWVRRGGLNFFDMSTMICLATGIETGLREWTINNAPTTASKIRRGAYQALDDSLVSSLATETGRDISLDPNWTTLRAVLAHRHLYAHRGGVLDEDYVRQIQAITSEDLRLDPALTNWPAEELYWFRPLKALPDLITRCRKFFSVLPS